MEAGAAAASSSPPCDHDESDHQPDFSPVGSPELTDVHFPPPPSNQTHPSDDLRRRIIKQVEYYFSDENLSTDKFLMNYITRDNGFVPIGVLASFRKLKKLTRDVSVIVGALRQSSLLVVSNSGKKVKRAHPLPITEVRDPQLCTVLVENLPQDHSVENLKRMFGEVGKVRHIDIRDPHSMKEGKKCSVAEKLLSGKLHALVEYDAVEAAEKAADTLNNEQDWRFGLRVRLLKKMNQPGPRKDWKESNSEKNGRLHASVPTAHDENHQISDHQDDSHDEEVQEHLALEKNGDNPSKEKNGHRARNRGRGRRQNNGVTNGHGHGAHNANHGFEPAKPPPGPRMPDGTKGFTMGRGRPLVVNQS